MHIIFKFVFRFLSINIAWESTLNPLQSQFFFFFFTYQHVPSRYLLGYLGG